MRQASRRSWRPGQKQPVRVHFLTYDQSLQSEGLRLAARKALNSLAVEGEIPEAGISAYAEGDGDVYVSLAKQIVNNLPVSESSADELQRAFARHRSRQDEAETPLVDPGQWRLPDPEPPAGRGPKAPPEPDERPSPTGQLTMFSLEEFAARPAGPKPAIRAKG